MKRFLLVLSALLLLTVSAQAQTRTYDWEDGGTIIGSYGDIIATNDDEIAHSGDYSLKLVDDAASGTPQAFVAWITGLSNGDTVTAGFWVYDTTPNASPSGRIWGSYTSDENDITSYAGSASGSNTYPDGTGWSYLEYTWTFDAGSDHTGLVIQARTYSTAGATIWVDDLSIDAPDSAVIFTPAAASAVPVPGAILLLGSGLIGLAGLKRKNS